MRISFRKCRKNTVFIDRYSTLYLIFDFCDMYIGIHWLCSTGRARILDWKKRRSVIGIARKNKKNYFLFHSVPYFTHLFSYVCSIFTPFCSIFNIRFLLYVYRDTLTMFDWDSFVFNRHYLHVQWRPRSVNTPFSTGWYYTLYLIFDSCYVYIGIHWLYSTGRAWILDWKKGGP